MNARATPRHLGWPASVDATPAENAQFLRLLDPDVRRPVAELCMGHGLPPARLANVALRWMLGDAERLLAVLSIAEELPAGVA